MFEINITTMPTILRAEAAIEAEKVVQFDEGDFLREVDAITPFAAEHFITLGARLGAEAMGLYFCDDNSESFVPGVSTEDIASFAASAAADVVRDAGFTPQIKASDS